MNYITGKEISLRLCHESLFIPKIKGPTRFTWKIRQTSFLTDILWDRESFTCQNGVQNKNIIFM